MAFYSTPVDDDGNETRRSTRSTFHDGSEMETLRSLASFQETCRDLKIKTCQTPNAFKTVRYVNSATFIEKDMKKPVEPEEKVEIDIDEEDEYDNDENFDSLSFCADTNKVYASHLAPGQFDNSIPGLELKSNESFPSSDNLTYSYRKVCEVTKTIQNDAYREWLDAKRTAKKFAHDKKKQEEKRIEDEKQERKRLAEEKFNKWLKKKSEAKNKEKIINKIQSTELIASNSCSKLMPDMKKDTAKNFNLWLQRKVSQKKLEHEKLIGDAQREEELNEKRKEESNLMYKEWLKTAPEKPKPVPLNKGMLTLKGSMSEMYSNPVAWVSDDLKSF